MRITDNDTAKQWLDNNGYHYELNDKDEVITKCQCMRCGGTGYWSRGHWNQGGICFACGGTGGKKTTYTAVKKYAQNLKTAQVRREKVRQEALAEAARREERKLEGQRNWCEANGYGRVTFAEKEAMQKVEREKAQKKQCYVGEVKQRLEIEVNYDFVFSFDGFYGTTYLYKFVTDEGNVLVWKTSVGLFDEKGFFIARGTRVKLTGTVKEHAEYKGTKQTVLTRCKVRRAEKLAPEPKKNSEPEFKPEPKPEPKPETKPESRTAREKFEQLFA